MHALVSGIGCKVVAYGAQTAGYLKIEPNAQESGYKCFGSDKFYVVPKALL